jgi:hypothetical protein
MPDTRPSAAVTENVVNLLNDDGSASMATALLMSHHAFRRDIARFAIALRRLTAGDASRVPALRQEWQSYRGALHGHHEVEDTRMFPGLRSEQAALVPVIDQLTAQHKRIDPLLSSGDRAFANLPETAAEAALIVGQLSALLDEHLALEEAHVIRFIRGARDFPPPGSDAEAAMYADGFAWASDGVAPEVLERVDAMLPEILRARLPAARAAFQERPRSGLGRHRPGRFAHVDPRLAHRLSWTRPPRDITSIMALGIEELNGTNCKTYLLTAGDEAALVDPVRERLDTYRWCCRGAGCGCGWCWRRTCTPTT